MEWLLIFFTVVVGMTYLTRAYLRLETDAPGVA
jgi:hypothetical protein